MFKLIRQLAPLFNKRERWQLAILFVALMVRAAVETIGVASIAPFMSMVADPAIIQEQPSLNWVYTELGFQSTTSFLMATGVGVIVLLAVSNSFSALALWGLLRFSWGTHHRLSVRLLRGYLSQPYSFFVQHNSATLNKTILTEVQTVISGVLVHVLNIVARALVIVALVALLVALDPMLAAITVATLGVAYGGVYLLVRKKQRKLGQERLAANTQRYKITSEAFGGIKDVKVLQREEAFLSRFKGPSWTLSKAMASNGAISQLPRYLLETIAFGGIVLIVVYYLSIGQGITEILPVLSLYAFAGYRLMPELQQLFTGLAGIRFNSAALADLSEDLQRFSPAVASKRPNESGGVPQDCITFQDVSFTYPGAAEPALRQATLTIQRNQTIGLVGPSGSGKTTLVDILLGLYLPDAGQILIDDVPLTEDTLSGWRSQLGYVPQHIFLCDDTIANNIAFGVPAAEVDQQRVEKAARIAHLHNFIHTLPDGYDTIVGERGVRLSGGQRQRIGIARAMYHDPAVLVMDEATSALDGATETAVMEAITELSGKKTIILIAHRLTTLRDCNVIVTLAEGRITGEANYQDLIAEQPGHSVTNA